VTFNPIKHVDPFGTIALPAILLLAHAPFLFGYGKSVPVRLRPRSGNVSTTSPNFE
jgi:Zn-dependent protease